MKLLALKILSVNLNFPLLAVFILISLLKQIYGYYKNEEKERVINQHYVEEIQRIKDMYQNSSQTSVFGRQIELFFPKYDFQRPDKFYKETYAKLYSHLADHKKRSYSMKDTFTFPDEITEESESIYKKELLNSLIKKEVSMEELNYGVGYEIYGFPDAKRYENEEPKFVHLQDPNVKIKNFEEISDFISFEPKELIIQEKPICIPTMTILNVKNTMNENLILRSVKSDLYQATIFYLRPGKDSNQSYNQKNIYPKTLMPGETMILQIIVLPDMVGKIRGNIYLEFNDNKVVVYPLSIYSVENIYRVHPIYFPNWLGSKLLTTPVSIYNPHSKTLIVKEVINSFSSINLIWPNGHPVSSNHTSISSSMLEIPPKTSKNLMMINFYKEVPGAEYGLLQMKTDKDTLILPVLVRVEIQGVKLFPNYYNFGMIDLNQNIKRLIPITLSNVSRFPLQVKALYTTFEENLIEFVPNINNAQCPYHNREMTIFNNREVVRSTKDKFNPSFCVINPSETLLIFGYLMLDPSNYNPDLNDQHLYKKFRGSLILQTNFTDNPFLELSYEYYLDKSTFTAVNSENSKGQSNLSLSSSTYSPKTQVNLLFDIGNNSKSSYSYEITTRIKSPFTFNIGSSIRSYLEEGENSSSKGLKGLNKISIFPESNQISVQYKENNDTLRLNITLNNPYTFQNKKNYFIPIKTSLNMISLLPVNFYDKSLELHYCESVKNYRECQSEVNYANYKSINFKDTTINLDYGMVSTSETGLKYFTILNDNNENIRILDIESSNPNLYLTIESIEDINTSEKVSLTAQNVPWAGAGVGGLDNLNTKLQRLLKKKAMAEEKEKIPFVLIANSYVTFAVNINSNVEQDMAGTIGIHFLGNEKTKVKLSLNASAKFLRGNLNISPSVIRFELAFPGFYQSRLVSSKSSYNIPISIHSVKSYDQRIIPTLLTNSIISHNRTEILKVIFDPSKVALEENFMRGDFVMNITNRYLTYKELYLWKEKQKLWELLGSQGRTEINTMVQIKTSIQSENVNVRAFLTKPSLVKKEVIDFGLVQIGEAVNRYIEVDNPSDETMTIQILLASEEFSDIYNNIMFSKNDKFRFSTENQVTLMECHFFNSTSVDYYSSNSTQNLILPKTSKKKKKKTEDESGIDIQNSIIIEENMNTQNKPWSKSDILRKLFLYAPHNTKTNFVSAERIICNSNSMTKNEIIMNNYKEMIDKIFSDEFNKEIAVVKRMTEHPPPSNQKKEGKETNIGVFERIAQFLKIFFRTEVPRRRVVDKSDKTSKETPAPQEFYLPKIVSSQIYQIKPHQKLKIGPIIFHPSTFSNNTATLFIKNNLTILYPIKLRGNGGSGMLNFSVVERGYENVENEVKLENNKLQLEIDSNTFKIRGLQSGVSFQDDTNSGSPISIQSDIVTRTIKLRNTGNLPVKISNISIENSGCEAYGIKLYKCDSVYLKPSEVYKMQISVKPDFNFYFIEKDIYFETQHKTVVLKISVNISNELLSMKNRLFNFDYLRNYGYISIFVVIFIVSVILYILSKEYAEMTENEYKQQTQPQSIQFLSSKELIESNPILKFENLFIKSYRKFNQGFYDDFVYKQFDKPGTGSLDIDGLGEKRKSSNKVSRERRSEDNKEVNVNQPDETESRTCKEKESKPVIREDKDTSDHHTESKDHFKTTPTGTKISTSKKEKESLAKGAGKAKKGGAAKKPIGLGTKVSEKKEEVEAHAGTMHGSSHGMRKDLTNKFDSYNATSMNTYQHKYPGSNLNANYDYSTYDANYYHYDAAHSVDNSGSVYANQGYWGKSYNNYYANAKGHQFQRGYDRYNYYNVTGSNANAYYNQTNNTNTMASTYTPGKTETAKSTTGVSKPVSHDNIVVEKEKPKEKRKEEVETETEKEKKMEKEKELESNISAVKENKEVKEPEKKEKVTIIKEDIKVSSPSEKNKKEETTGTNIKEQFMAFAPDIFGKVKTDTTTGAIIPAAKESEKTKEEEPKMKAVSQPESEHEEKQIETQANELMNNFNNFKTNFDFTNIFTKSEPQEMEKSREKENVSEIDEGKNYNEEDASSHNYQSEREKMIDSGTEDFRFNFNSIFTHSNMNMKFSHLNYNNDYTDNEETQPKDESKPYFDKNLFFSFDSAFSKPNMFNANPFANTNTKQSRLKELRDDDNNNDWEDKGLEDERNKIDEVAEIDDEYDDEEDPLWGEDNVDIGKEGYFDETGTYKLKQIDFNFDLDFKMKK